MSERSRHPWTARFAPVVVLALVTACGDNLPRLEPRFLEFSDGSVQFFQWWDQQFSIPCVRTNQELCEPQVGLMFSQFLDSECRGPRVEVARWSFSLARFGGRDPEFRRVLEPVATYFVDRERVCRRQFGYHRVGEVFVYDEFSPDRTDELDSTIEQRVENGERLEARFRTRGDGSQVFAGWNDLKLDTPCSMSVVDTLRCVPQKQVEVFAVTSDCRVDEVGAGSADDADTRFVFDAWRQEFFEVDGVYEGPIYRTRSGRCEQVPEDIAVRHQPLVRLRLREPSIFVSAAIVD